MERPIIVAIVLLSLNPGAEPGAQPDVAQPTKLHRRQEPGPEQAQPESDWIRLNPDDPCRKSLLQSSLGAADEAWSAEAFYLLRGK